MKKSFIYILGVALMVVALAMVGCTGTTPSNPTNPSNGTPATTANTVPSQPGSSAPGGNSPVSGQPITTGKLEVVVTDAPTKEQITAIWVSLNNIEIHQAGIGNTSAALEGQTVEGTQETQDQPGDSAGWTTIKLDPANKFDLLTVAKTPSVLASIPTNIGNYSMIRMEINTIQVQFAGADKPVDATVPSGKIKFNQLFKVSATDVTQLVFDFDAAQSVNITGNGKVLFKPVIRLAVNKKSGDKESNTSNQNKDNANKDNPNQAALAITTASLPDGKVNTAYAANIKLEATGGKTPYTWSITGALPGGMALNPTTGVISGTPTAAGDFSITVKVTDNSKPEAKTNTKALTIHIAP